MTRGLSGIEDRKRRVELALNILKGTDNLTVSKAISLISFDLGVRISKASEYVHLLLDSGKLEEQNGYLKLKE